MDMKCLRVLAFVASVMMSTVQAANTLLTNPAGFAYDDSIECAVDRGDVLDRDPYRDAGTDHPRRPGAPRKLVRSE